MIQKFNYKNCFKKINIKTRDLKNEEQVALIRTTEIRE